MGDFLAHAARWTGRDAGEIVALLRGTSRISLGFSTDELEAVRRAIVDDPRAAEVLAGGDGGRGTLSALAAHGGDVADRLAALLDLVEHRALGYSAAEPTCGELPEVLVKAIRAAVGGKFEVREGEVAAATAALRDAVPEEHRAHFDALLEEARVVNRLRDERGMFADCWAIGILRRAAREVGRRFAERGALEAADHVFDLTAEEASAMLRGEAGPPKREVAERTEWRLTKTVADCPPFLNGEPAPPPDPSILPEAARRATVAVGTMIENLFTETKKTSTDRVVRGISVNHGTYEGIARVVDGSEDFPRIQQGDVLVTRATAPYFNVVLPLLGAIVTDRGGQLCHAAIVAREYGIPGIVGTKEATKRIPDGARVRVDGASGEVVLL